MLFLLSIRVPLDALRRDDARRHPGQKTSGETDTTSIATLAREGSETHEL